MDVLGYYDQVTQYVEKKLNQPDLNRVTSRSYIKVPASSVGLGGTRRIALVVGEGARSRAVPGGNSLMNIKGSPPGSHQGR